jgi:hypothetical protein
VKGEVTTGQVATLPTANAPTVPNTDDLHLNNSGLVGRAPTPRSISRICNLYGTLKWGKPPFLAKKYKNKICPSNIINQPIAHG